MAARPKGRRGSRSRRTAQPREPARRRAADPEPEELALERDPWFRVRWTLERMEHQVRRALEAQGFDLADPIRGRDPGDFPRQELHALGCIERCREAIRSGDAPAAVLAMHDAAKAHTTALRKHRGSDRDEVDGMVARRIRQEAAPKGGHARARRHQVERVKPLLAEARKRWIEGGRKPRDARRIAEALHQEGFDARSPETLRKIIGPELR